MSLNPSSYVVLVPRPVPHIDAAQFEFLAEPAEPYWLGSKVAPREPARVRTAELAHHFASFKDAAQSAMGVFGIVIALTRGQTDQHLMVQRERERAGVVAKAVQP